MAGRTEEAAVVVASTCAVDGGCDADDAGLMQLRQSSDRATAGVSDVLLVSESAWFPTFNPAGSWTTVQKATATCKQQAGCAGFFLQGSPPADSTTEIFAWFATAEGMAQEIGYTAYQIVPGEPLLQPASTGSAYEEWKDTFFASYDPNGGSWQTVASAQAECSKLSACNGFFFMGMPAADGSIFAWFSTSSSTATASGYTAYTKGAGSSPPAPAPISRSTTGTVSSEEWELFELTNQARAEGVTCPADLSTPAKDYAPNGTPLDFDCRLWQAARMHSTEMADQNYFSHYSLDGSTPEDRVEEFGAQGAPGECFVAGPSTVEEALQSLLQSTGHCNIIMDTKYNRMGDGYAYSESSTYKNYWTKVFIDGTDTIDRSCYPERASLTPAKPPQVANPQATMPGAAKSVVSPGGGWTMEKVAGLRSKLQAARAASHGKPSS